MRLTSLTITAAAAASIASASPAFATVFYDASLIDPPGTYFGTGNSNVHWTVDEDASGLELGLQTGIRFTNSVTPSAGTATYYVPLGNTSVGGKSGSAWGFAFSVNDISTGLPLTSITTSLSVLDVVTGQTVTIDPSLIPDNSKTGSPASAFQNSEALSFTNGVASGFDPAYNAFANDTYVVTLSATGPNGSLGSVSETIVAGTGAPLPEPASLALFGAGLLGLRVVRRKVRRTTAGSITG